MPTGQPVRAELSRRVSRVRAAVAAGAVAVSVGLTGCAGADAAAGGPIKVGSVLDLTGPLNIYGEPKSRVAKLAIDDINARGGVLGRQLELIQYDSQSSTDKNVEFANKLANADNVAVVMGGITSASREAMRPALRRAETLYFYNTLYEGGVCDRNQVITGATASQSTKPLVDEAIATGAKRIYIVAADYNFGRISTQWIEKYAAAAGVQIVGTDFIGLDSNNFAATLGSIQQTRPDAVMSLLVGANHVPFYREFAAKGLNRSTKIYSATFGGGNEQEILSPAEAKGIITVYGYYEELENPANAAFKQKFGEVYGADHPYITDLAITEWNAWHLWAAAAAKAGSVDRQKVIEAIEAGGISVDSPSGKAVLDAKSHHTVMDVTIAAVNDNQGFDLIRTLPAQPPAFEQSTCDLIAQPETNRAFTP